MCQIGDRGRSNGAVCWITLLLNLAKAEDKVCISPIILFEVTEELVEEFICLLGCGLLVELLVNFTDLYLLVKYFTYTVNTTIL